MSYNEFGDDDQFCLFSLEKQDSLQTPSIESEAKIMTNEALVVGANAVKNDGVAAHF